MENEKHLVSLKDGSSVIVKITSATLKNFSEEAEFILFKDALIRRDEIISVIKIEDSFDVVDNIKIDGLKTIWTKSEKTSKIINESMKSIKKNIFENMDGLSKKDIETETVKGFIDAFSPSNSRVTAITIDNIQSMNKEKFIEALCENLKKYK